MKRNDHGASPTTISALTHHVMVARLLVCLMLVGCATGCATTLEITPVTHAESVAQPSFHPLPAHAESKVPQSIRPVAADSKQDDKETIEDGDARESGPELLSTQVSMTGQTATTACAAGLAHTTGYRACDAIERWITDEPALERDMPLRPPLRQTWFHHAPLIPMGSDADLWLPDAAVLAHRDRVSSRPLRNAYGGMRDQPLLHRDSSRDPSTHSTLPEIGPPPPHHMEKTVTVLIGGTLLGFGAYAFLPSSFTGTTKDGAVEEAWEHFQDAWTKPPVIDKDREVVNYLGHPYFGMSFYLSQRNFGESPLRSFLFSVATSTAFEYLVESWAERPSIQDLIVTPIVGSILGELVFRATQEMRKDGFTTAEKIMVTIINPLYVLQQGYR